MPIRDTRMIQRAFEQRWKFDPGQRAAVIARLLGVIANRNSSPREVTAAAKALLAAEAQNQADEHKVIDVSVSTSNHRLDAIAAELGIEIGFVEAITRQADSGTSGVEVGANAIDTDSP